MFRQGSTRFIPNNLFTDQNGEDYKRNKKIKGKIKVDERRRKPFQEVQKENIEQKLKMSEFTMKKASQQAPKVLEIQGFDNESQSSVEQKESQKLIFDKKKKSLGPHQSSTPQKIIQQKKQMDQVQQNQAQQKAKNGLSVSKKRNIFNLQFEDSSDSQQNNKNQEKQSQINQTNPSKQQSATKSPIRNNIQNANNNLRRFLIDDSEDESDQIEECVQQNNKKNQQQFPKEQISEEVLISREASNKNLEEKKKKFLFDQNDFQDSDEENMTTQNQNQSLQENKDLEILKKINIQKLKSLNPYANSNQTKQTQIMKKYDHLLNQPIPKNHIFSMMVKRCEQNSSYAAYDDQLVRHVIGVKKNGSTYKFFAREKQQVYSKNKTDKNKKTFQVELAKMKANFLGTQFHCYLKNEENSKTKYKKHCISIKYETNILGLNGPRKISLFAPRDGHYIEDEKNLMELYEENPSSQSAKTVDKFINKAPKWCPEINAYVLDFKGRAIRSSVKNCIITDVITLNNQFMVFGKVSKDVFNLDIRDKFSIVQAIALAVSSFQKKLGCE